MGRKEIKLQIDKETVQLRSMLERTRLADKYHDEVMKRVAARGGLTLEQLRSLSPKEKDDFIFQHRDRGETG